MELTLVDSEPELTYLFKHIVTQEVSYESLPYATRAMLHEQVAQYLERFYAAQLDQFVDLLAFHYDRSSNEAKRREYLLKAAEAAQHSADWCVGGREKADRPAAALSATARISRGGLSG